MNRANRSHGKLEEVGHDSAAALSIITKRIVGDRALYLNPWASERKERPMED